MMKINISNNRVWAVVISLFILMSCLVMIFTGLDLSSDVTITNTHICHSIQDECIKVNDSNIFSDEFEETQVCADYESSRRNSLEVFLLYETGGPNIGLLVDRTLEKGKYQICYHLKDIVESWENVNMEEENPSPINEGAIEPGIYRVVFERGRVQLDEFYFQVFPTE